MPFRGFSTDALRFLADLAANNDRAWFQAHRDVYERELLEPARDLVEAIGTELERRGIAVNADPRVGGSIMRIARDTRFSNDNRPYKSHLDLWFWQGAGPARECPGFWFRLAPKELLLGVGMHHFERPLLARYREAVADERRGTALVGAVAKLEGAGYSVWGRNYKRVPASFDPAHERGDLLRHDGLYAGIELELPPELTTPRFPGFCADHYERMRPLQDWLVSLVST